ncbi:MAG: LapA family protein [Deltaproteobacteria bacterium]|jgi:hypothetical protein|nr:LapA family protein [Deltaproteobacteria bacterium]
MRNVKLVLFVVICGCGGFFVYQNLLVFTNPVDLKLDIFNAHYEWLQIKSFFIFLAFFAAGLIVAFFLSLGGRLKTARTIKAHKAQLKKKEEELSALQKATAATAAAAAAAVVDTSAVPPADSDAEANAPEQNVKDKTENAG